MTDLNLEYLYVCNSFIYISFKEYVIPMCLRGPPHIMTHHILNIIDANESIEAFMNGFIFIVEYM